MRIFNLVIPSASARKATAVWLSYVSEALGALVFPWSCAICEMEGVNGPLCKLCREGLLEKSAKVKESVCPRCALKVGPFADLRGGCAACRDRAFGFDAALALGEYAGELRDLCLRLKHERNAWLAPCLSALLVEARGEALGALCLDGVLVVPVPLHWWRYLQRGYNQAEALAESVAKQLKLPIRRPLKRVVGTRRLAGLSRTARNEVMRDVFRARACSAMKGRTVLLVDDVLTTGTTCSAAAKALKKAGASRVVVAVIARTEQTSV